MTGPGGDGGETSSSARNRRRRPEPSPTQRALGLLTRREHSRKELARKLVSRGVETADACAVVDKLTAAGWQDDTRFAQSLVRSRAGAGYGPGWIRAELGTHGLGAEAVLAALASFEEDWADVARGLIRRRFSGDGPLDVAQRRKAADLLLRRGFSMEHVRTATRQE
ncbi:regulatory protein RecX [Thermomonas carbonis]|uniref:Regulatory protein RecX n=1 Tax=Thermomonas carbonis TaxID=1463158 RepID=A0A7G9SQ82_9GAMM|nr:regulatory protein RecX [Thermomonas carbonis]QNN70007.1 regulatory protein RecX [Thermomonas carbonis]GHB97048.1 regulatory protein RecX [Thermomonas carbonis]